MSIEKKDDYLDNVIRRLKNPLAVSRYFLAKNFQMMYSFTNENVGGYINSFELDGNNLLTVGSSADQAFNAIYKGCKDVTLIDVCPFAKYYFYLKAAAIDALNLDEFGKFFCHVLYNDLGKVYNNPYIFNIDLYCKLRNTLKELDFDSYNFWNNIIPFFQGNDIMKQLFFFDESSWASIQSTNLYLSSINQYRHLGEQLSKTNVRFIHGNVLNYNESYLYDNIWLSNIVSYLKEVDIIKLINDMKEHLNENGKLMISYIWNTDDENIFPLKSCFDYPEIVRVRKVYREFWYLMNLHPSLISFAGMIEINNPNEYARDSVLVYKKKI